MNRSNPLQIALATSALIIGIHALASFIAEWNALDRPEFSSDPNQASTRTSSQTPGWLQIVPPFRSDLAANYALIDAFQTIRMDREKSSAEGFIRNDVARGRVRKLLLAAPYNSELWLAFALLQAQRDPRDPSFSEALKMSYFLTPNQASLMPARLDMATLFDALLDPDLRELAHGDVRSMLTRQADLKVALVSAYRRASGRGKAFLEEAVQSVDPSFLVALRG